MGLKAWGLTIDNDPSERFRLIVCPTYGADNNFNEVFSFSISVKEKHPRITFADTLPTSIG